MRIILTSQSPWKGLREKPRSPWTRLITAAFPGGTHHKVARHAVRIPVFQSRELGVSRGLSLSSGLRNPSYTIRGCAAPSWCQSLHVAEAFDLTHVNVSCCTGNGCNHPARDTQPGKGGAPKTSPAHLSFFVSLLLTARLWGATLLCT